MTYADFRTGFTYREVFGMLWVDDPDPSTWRQKRRASVLGFWHELKRDLWREHLAMCQPCEPFAGRPEGY